ncbi:alpha/beta hydrolase [Mesorhizobium sp. INR15]|uniref:alpha/beta hydrolase n=1 Tax=Mesorhizobium sp. INR15 TaxID=2654248 RepID=UPI00189669E7|nr:alpha/beta hydrolase [Mesorhizobium sp. INR15]QPC94434.1 alpha/beta hydrolase [Mesorhizobium sp. INR15]
MAAPELSFIHHFEPGPADAIPVLLLHGTGGDENALLPFGRLVAPGHALLSPRGKVLEQGKARYFRRFAEGILDEDDVRRRAGELADFVAAAQAVHDLPPPIAIGFSNGANIAAAMLFLRPAALAGAALLRPMMPLAKPPVSDLGGKRVLIVSGADDPVMPAGDDERLARQLRLSGAVVRTEILPRGGHDICAEDEDVVAAWMARLSHAASGRS